MDLPVQGEGRGIWFLAESAGGWSLKSVRRTPLSVEDMGIALASLAQPLEEAYESSGPLDKLIAELSNGLIPGNLGTFVELTPFLNVLVGPQQDAMRAHARAGEFGHNGTCIAEAQSQRWSLTLASEIENSIMRGEAWDSPSLLGALSRLADPGAASSVARIVATASQQTIRRAGALALAAMHSEETIASLDGLVDDADAEVRYSAIRGLAMFAAGCAPGSSTDCSSSDATRRRSFENLPAFDVYSGDPEVFTGFWRSWYPNVSPSVAITGSPTCHPTPSTPCSVTLSAVGIDGNHDPLDYSWAGNNCALASNDTAVCTLSQPGSIALTVVASDGRGGTASSTQSVQGVNATPFKRAEYWGPTVPLPRNARAEVNIIIKDDDSQRSRCEVTRVYRKCVLRNWKCSATGANGETTINVKVDTLGTSGLCSIDYVFEDPWGAVHSNEAAAEVQ
jgi:hypothetical protein